MFRVANLAKRLKSVWLFGARCDGDVADSAAAFYHSVAATRATDALFLASPSKCALGLALPLSTSRKVSAVLSRHGHDAGDGDGLVLELSMAADGGCALCCLACDAFSDFGAEAQRLFWGHTHSLHLASLASLRSGFSLELLLGDLLVCFDVLDKALSAGFQFGVAQLGDALRSRVRALLRCAKDCDGDDEDYDLPQYVVRWSRLLCAERREIALNRDAYAFVAPLLCRRLRLKDKESVFIDLAAIAATFANCESLRSRPLCRHLLAAGPARHAQDARRAKVARLGQGLVIVPERQRGVASSCSPPTILCKM